MIFSYSILNKLWKTLYHITFLTQANTLHLLNRCIISWVLLWYCQVFSFFSPKFFLFHLTISNLYPITVQNNSILFPNSTIGNSIALCIYIHFSFHFDKLLYRRYCYIYLRIKDMGPLMVKWLKNTQQTSGTASAPTQVSAFIEKIYTFMWICPHIQVVWLKWLLLWFKNWSYWKEKLTELKTNLPDGSTQSSQTEWNGCVCRQPALPLLLLSKLLEYFPEEPYLGFLSTEDCGLGFKIHSALHGFHWDIHAR